MAEPHGPSGVGEQPWSNFLGVRVEALTLEELDRRVENWLSDKSARSHYVACLNAYCTTLAAREPRLQGIYNGADLAGPDSMPFTLWNRWILGQPCDRYYGPDVVLRLAALAEQRGYSFYLYGGAPDVAAAMAAELVARHPGLRLLGHHSPPFRPLTEAEDRELCDELNALRPDIVCVGLGTPKQDYWIDDHMERVRGSVMVACGAAFDFIAGRVRQAPRFVQRSGFEWLWRLLSRDFRRLWRRYTLSNLEFVWRFALQRSGIAPRPVRTSRRPETTA